jgi:hypothetical protein
MFDDDDPTIVETEEQLAAEREVASREALAEAARVERLPWPLRFGPAASWRTYEADRFEFHLEEGEYLVIVSLGWRAGRQIVEAIEAAQVAPADQMLEAKAPPRKNPSHWASFAEFGPERLNVFVAHTPSETRLDVVTADGADEGRGLSVILPSRLFDQIVERLYRFLSSPPHIWRRSIQM